MVAAPAGIVLWLLKKGTLTVKYSLIWLLCGAVLLLFAICPYFVYVIRDILGLPSYDDFQLHGRYGVSGCGYSEFPVAG